MPENTRRTAQNANEPITVLDLLHARFNKTNLDIHCETCDEPQVFSEQQSITYLPEYLILIIARFGSGPDGTKLKDRVHFEIDGLDMHTFIHPKKRTLKHSKYSCMAALHHRGNERRAGHNETYLREQLLNRKDIDTRWVLYNDGVVSAVRAENEIMVSPLLKQILDEQFR